MAIKRVVHKLGGAKEHMVVPEFAFATNAGTASNKPASPTTNTGDLLAQMIVDAWQNVNFTYTPSSPPGSPPVTAGLFTLLMDRNAQTHLPTQKAVDAVTQYLQNKVNLILSRAVVISEAEHNNDYILQSDDEIAFVLPDPTRVTSVNPSANLLQTAEFLMACTPNGI
jgi:hypothetical protein